MSSTTNKVVPTTPTTTTPTPLELIKKFGGTKSSAIRGLFAEGKTRTEIKTLLGIRYQHVRNVLITPIKKVSVGRVGGMEDLTS